MLFRIHLTTVQEITIERDSIIEAEARLCTKTALMCSLHKNATGCTKMVLDL